MNHAEADLIIRQALHLADEGISSTHRYSPDEAADDESVYMDAAALVLSRRPELACTMFDAGLVDEEDHPVCSRCVWRQS